MDDVKTILADRRTVEMVQIYDQLWESFRADDRAAVAMNIGRLGYWLEQMAKEVGVTPPDFGGE